MEHNLMQSSCSKCVFAKTDGYNQTGCYAGRIEKFIALGAQKNDSGYYTIPSVCNLSRDKNVWRKDADNMNEMLSAARYEVAPLFGVAVRDCPGKPLSELEKTVESIIALDYDKDKIKTVLSSFPGRGLSAVSHLVNVMKERGNKHSSCVFHINHRTYAKDTEVFKKLTQAHYFVNVQAGTVLRPDLFKIVDESLNESLEKIFMFEDHGVTIVNKHVMTKVYLDFSDYDKAVDHIRSLSAGKPQTNERYACLQEKIPASSRR